jgi:hypothetical protein
MFEVFMVPSSLFVCPLPQDVRPCRSFAQARSQDLHPSLANEDAHRSLGLLKEEKRKHTKRVAIFSRPFLPLANLYMEADRVEEAVGVLRRGCELARSKTKKHAHTPGTLSRLRGFSSCSFLRVAAGNGRRAA